MYKNTYLDAVTSRRLYIPPEIADGTYPITNRFEFYSFNSKNVTSNLTITSIPQITVEDINFGEVDRKSNNTEVRTSEISLSSGSPGEEVQVYPGSNVVELSNFSGLKVSVNVSVTPEILTLDSSGNGSSMLLTEINPSDILEDGFYSGSVEIFVAYN